MTETRNEDKKDTDKEIKSKRHNSVFNIQHYLLAIATIILFGQIAKRIKTFDRNAIGKVSLITGIPIIRQRFFLIPLMMNILFLILLIYYFNNDNDIQVKHSRSLLKYLKAMKCGCFFSNWYNFICFYICYHKLILPISTSSGWKISGHVIAISLSSNIMLNIHHICEDLLDNYPNTKNIHLTQYTIFAIRFLLAHSLYTLFWTAWIFHAIRDLVLSLIISAIYIFLLKYCFIDYLILRLITKSLSRQIKEKNIMWSNNLKGE